MRCSACATAWSSISRSTRPARRRTGGPSTRPSTRPSTTSGLCRRRSEALVKIGKATVPRSAICRSDEDAIVVRGHDLARELIGKISFADHFFLLLTGRMPDAPASAVINATLVAIAEHGLVPSVQAARMTLAAAPDAMQGAVAAGILGSGSVILGASETAGRLFVDVENA